MRALLPLLALAALLAGCDDAPKGAARGRIAPEIAVLDGADDAVDLARHRGKAVLVSFWFTGCGPCTAELPVLDAFVREHGAERVAILPVNMVDDAATIRATYRRLGLEHLPVLRDSVRITTRRYGVTGVPANFLIDSRGIVVERVDGALDHAALESRLLPLAKPAS